jgi:DNA-binding CsgD family transcriptional regulator
LPVSITHREAAGPASLTLRERSVANLVATGISNAEIAGRLGVGVKAVEKHLGSIYKKLALPSRTKLIVYLRDENAVKRRTVE